MIPQNSLLDRNTKTYIINDMKPMSIFSLQNRKKIFFFDISFVKRRIEELQTNDDKRIKKKKTIAKCIDHQNE